MEVKVSDIEDRNVEITQKEEKRTQHKKEF